MLAQRVLSAILIVPLALVFVWLGGIWFLAGITIVALIAGGEFYSLLRLAGFFPLWPFGIVLIPVFLVDRYVQSTQASVDVFAISICVSLTYMLVRKRLEGGFLDWAVTWAPPIYAGLLLSYAVALRQLPAGERLSYFALAIAWSTDTGAYFAGRALGRHGFFPRISPRKTLEGAIGGVVCGVVVGSVLAVAFGWDLVRIVPLALLASLAGEIGDLAESFFKRQFGAKDAGRLIPGHGGVLDRLDSVIFVAMATYFWSIWIGGAV